jgi:uncharacterized protein (TIGR02231 family)
METKKMNIKRICMISLLLFFSFKAGEASGEKRINAKVKKAIVFLQGAQLFSEGNFSIPAGTSDLIFEGVSPFIDPNSLQSSGNSNTIILLETRHNILYPEITVVKEKVKPKNLNKIRAVEDSIRELDWILEEIADKRAAMNTEKNTLLNNRLIKGETKRDTLALLKDAIDYLRIRLNNINTELSKIKREEYKTQSNKERFEKFLADLHEENAKSGEINPSQKGGAINQVIITVSSLFAVEVKIEINYFVNNAGWTPSYDLRATSANNNLKLDHRANVYQNSGIEWTDANLTLSTGTPNQSNMKPELTVAYLNYYVARSYNYQGSTAPAMSSMALKSMQDVQTLDKAEETAAQPSSYTVVVENPIRVDYEIKLKYTIPSDSKTHLVIIQSKEIPSNFVYSAVPKMDQNAFLVAKITDWEELNLIPGSARVYYDGAYIGASELNPNEMDDTLKLNMGRDKSITIQRKKIRDKSKEMTFNNDRILTYTFEITMRNTKSSSIKMELEDQIPVSQNEEIKVTLIESTSAYLNETTGNLKWQFNLKPKEVKKIKIEYEVKYPKSKQLAGL